MFKWPHYNEFDKQIQGRVGRPMKQGELVWRRLRLEKWQQHQTCSKTPPRNNWHDWVINRVWKGKIEKKSHRCLSRSSWEAGMASWRREHLGWRVRIVDWIFFGIVQLTKNETNYLYEVILFEYFMSFYSQIQEMLFPFVLEVTLAFRFVTTD